jgi:TRAP-type C4-dicarboxylate transport system permease small subunit
MRGNALAFLRRLRAVNERVGRVMNDVAGWLFVACALFVSIDVIARKFFNVSSRATVELTGYMLAFGLAWGLCDALTTRAHIRVDVLVTRMPLSLRVWMHGLALAFLAVLAFFLVWRGWAVVHDSWEFNAHDSSALTIPLTVPQALWAIGLTAFFLLTVLMLVEVALLLVLGRRLEVDRMLGPRTLAEEAGEALEAAGLPRHEPAVPANAAAPPAGSRVAP